MTAERTRRLAISSHCAARMLVARQLRKLDSPLADFNFDVQLTADGLDVAREGIST